MLQTKEPFPYQSRRSFCRIASKILAFACTLAAMAALVMLFFIVSYMVVKGIGSMDLAFFTNLPLETPMGMRNCIVGTGILVGLAGLFGVPLGMLCGIYLNEYVGKGWFTLAIRLIMDVLAGTPTIILGVVCYELIVVPQKHFSGWAGAIALALIMIPIVARATEEMLRLVPATIREASAGLGASKAQTLLRVVLPAAKSGIATGILLAVARVAGETAPLLFTALGNSNEVYNPNKPYPSLTIQIFNYSQSAEPAWRHQAWTAVLVLVAMILVFSAAVRLAVRGKKISRI